MSELGVSAYVRVHVHVHVAGCLNMFILYRSDAMVVENYLYAYNNLGIIYTSRRDCMYDFYHHFQGLFNLNCLLF